MEQVAAAAVVAERDRLLDELRRAWDGDAWHGDPVRRVLDGITAQQAAARPLPSAHGIWELVLHMTSWTREVTRRLRDRVAREPADGDWPSVLKTGEGEWNAALEALAAAHAGLVDAVAAFPPAELDHFVGDERDRPLGAGVSYAVMLHGLAQHHAYHAGQIALLKKSFG
ncbi:MAG TPA: DinB family protein [Longimicrobium sp.]|nr:DinB family protein [Longimicrobium sp.]